MNNNVIRFTTNIYDLAVIQKAANDYKSICDIDVFLSKSAENVGYKESYIICTILNSKTDIQLTMKEFCNYVVEQMNVRKK